jgi:hypothetical protein
MNSESSLQRLLMWRADRAEGSAPPPPRAARLLELCQPWWAQTPEHFRRLLTSLDAIHVRYGHAMVDAEARGRGHPVPAIVARQNVELRALAHVGFFKLDGRRLRLRFQLQPPLDAAEARVDATFVALEAPTPLFEAPALLSAGEYRVDVELPDALAASWAQLKVTDRMPFRFLIRSHL